MSAGNDPSLEEDSDLKKRAFLQQNEFVQLTIQRFWQILPRDENGRLPVEGYVDLNVRLQKALVPEFQVDTAVDSALQDWHEDCAEAGNPEGATSMGYEDFNWFVFELCGLWCRHKVQLREYLFFLNCCFLRITEGDPPRMKPVEAIGLLPQVFFDALLPTPGPPGQAASEQSADKELSFAMWYVSTVAREQEILLDAMRKGFEVTHDMRATELFQLANYQVVKPVRLPGSSAVVMAVDPSMLPAVDVLPGMHYLKAHSAQGKAPSKKSMKASVAALTHPEGGQVGPEGTGSPARPGKVRHGSPPPQHPGSSDPIRVGPSESPGSPRTELTHATDRSRTRGTTRSRSARPDVGRPPGWSAAGQKYSETRLRRNPSMGIAHGGMQGREEPARDMSVVTSERSVMPPIRERVPAPEYERDPRLVAAAGRLIGDAQLAHAKGIGEVYNLPDRPPVLYREKTKPKMTTMPSEVTYNLAALARQQRPPFERVLRKIPADMVPADGVPKGPLKNKSEPVWHEMGTRLDQILARAKRRQERRKARRVNAKLRRGRLRPPPHANDPMSTFKIRQDARQLREYLDSKMREYAESFRAQATGAATETGRGPVVLPPSEFLEKMHEEYVLKKDVVDKPRGFHHFAVESQNDAERLKMVHKPVRHMDLRATETLEQSLLRIMNDHGRRMQAEGE